MAPEAQQGAPSAGSEQPSIFRKAALDRLASPERLDERLALPAYPAALVLAAAALLAAVAGFAIWLLVVRG